MKIFLDGKMWCVLSGENLQEGVAGFGSTVAATLTTDEIKKLIEDLKK